MNDYFRPQGDYYNQFAQPTEQFDPWAPVGAEQSQGDPWAIPMAPPPQPLDESPPATSAEMEAIIQQSQGSGQPQEPLATVNLNPAQWSQYGKKDAAPAADVSNYAGWGRYGGY